MIVPDGFYASADILTPNAIEAEALSGVGISDVGFSGTRRRHAYVSCTAVNVSLSRWRAKGCLSRRMCFARAHMPPFEVDAVATVAAGDAFAGVLGRALCEGNDLGRCDPIGDGGWGSMRVPSWNSVSDALP